MFAAMSRTIVAAYLLCFSILITYLLSDYFFAAQAPISIVLDKKEYAPGEALSYAAKFIRKKACKTDVQRFIVKQKLAPINGGLQEVDAETVYRDQIIGLIVQGVEVVTTRSPLPPPPNPMPKLEPGHYKLRIFVISQCSIVNRIDKYPDVEFSIVGESK